MKSLIISIIILLFTMQLSADVISVPSEQPTILAAITVANEGDTVLVSPGTYQESIYLEKNLTLASEYLTMGDTSIISNTIIDGNYQWRPIDGFSLDSTTTICGFTLINGHASNGGAIRLIDSSPVIHNLVIRNCVADSSGGGIYCLGGFLKLNNVQVENNQAKEDGGGILAVSSNLNNISVKDNVALEDGGGIAFKYPKYPYESITANIRNSYIAENTAHSSGGGIYTSNSSSVQIGIHNSIIEKNTVDGWGGGMLLHDVESAVMDSVLVQYNKSQGHGGGIDFYHSDGENILISATTIRYNKTAGRGGGIRIYLNQPQFSKQNLCSVYLNEAAEGSDMWFDVSSDGAEFELDTCTVAKHTSYHIAFQSTSEHNITINTGLIEQIQDDIYVDPEGNNSNNGLTANTPLESISNALLKVYADKSNPRTINLSDGVYKPSDIEFFPLNLPAYITLKGTSRENTILDGVNQFSVVVTNPGMQTWNKISNLKIQNSESRDFGVIYARSVTEYDSLILSNIEISNCINSSASILNSPYCFLNLDSVVFINNIADDEIISTGRKLNLTNSKIIGNKTGYRGIVYFSGNEVNIENTLIACNHGSSQGIHLTPTVMDLPCYVRIINSTLTSNDFNDDGPEIFSRNRNLTMYIINSILWNKGDSDVFLTTNPSDSVIVAYSDIKGGQDNIDTRGKIIWDESNITEDPLFADTSSADFSLSNDSPCVNKGTDLFVWQGDTLVNITKYFGSAPDMGAFENTDPADIDDSDYKPFKYKLKQNYPNPFNPVTTISFSLPVLSRVSLKVYDITGRLVDEILSLNIKAGNHELQFDGSKLASGLYFYKLTAESLISKNGYSNVKQMLLIK